MIDNEAVALTLLMIRAEADSDVHARQAVAEYLVSQMGGDGADALSFGQQDDDEGYDWPEWLASDQHPIDQPFPGANGRWFVRKDTGGGKSRVVPAPNPDKQKAAPKEKSAAKEKPPAAKPKAALAAKPAAKKTPAKAAPKLTPAETWAKVQDAIKDGGSADEAVQALAGLSLADIRSLRDQHKGAAGGRSKSEVAQRLIAAVQARGEKPAEEKKPAAKATPPASKKDALPSIPKGMQISKDYPEEGIRVVVDANGDNRTTLTTPRPEAVQRIAPVLKQAFERALRYDESSGGLVSLGRLVTEIERATPTGQKITRREIFDALDQMGKERGLDLHDLNETWLLTDKSRADGKTGPLGGYDDIDGATLWKEGRAKHFVSLAGGVSSIDQAIEKGSAGTGTAPSPAKKQDEPGFTGTDSQGREWQNGELVAAKEGFAAEPKSAKQATPAAKPKKPAPEVGQNQSPASQYKELFDNALDPLMDHNGEVARLTKGMTHAQVKEMAKEAGFANMAGSKSDLIQRMAQKLEARLGSMARSREGIWNGGQPHKADPEDLAPVKPDYASMPDSRTRAAAFKQHEDDVETWNNRQESTRNSAAKRFTGKDKYGRTWQKGRMVDRGPMGDQPAAKPDAPGFTGIDAQGREWRDGELVARKEEPAATPTPEKLQAAFQSLPGAKDNLVSLADLQDALQVDTPTLHALVNDLRRKGVLTATGLEGRTGTPAEKQRLKAAGIPDGQNTIGFVSLGDAGAGAGAVAKPAAPPPASARVEPLPEAGKEILGKAYTPEAIAAMVAAPADSTTTVNQDDYGDLAIKTKGRGYYTQYVVGKDPSGKLHARMADFYLHPSLQGKGIASRSFASTVGEMQKAGISRIDMRANRSEEENGYYTWAVLGVDQPIGEFSPKDQDQIRRAFPQAGSVQDIMSSSEGREWWKKNGYTMQSATFDLKDGSRSLRILAAYAQERANAVAARGPDRLSLDMETGQKYESIDLNEEEERALQTAWEKLDAEQLALDDDSTADDLDSAHALAQMYADALNLLERTGDDVEDLAEGADAELDGTGWNLARDEDTDLWIPVRDEAEDDPEQMAMGGTRSPKGGIDIGGKFYRGGQFIPGAALASASPEDKRKLEAAKEASASAAAAKADSRKARGSVDTTKLRGRLEQHATKHALDGLDRRRAGAAARLLHRHHGELALHRVEELADRLEAALGRIDEKGYNAEGLRTNLEQQLARLHAVGTSLHQNHDVTGQIDSKHPVPKLAQTGGVGMMSTHELNVDPSRFQFKLNTDPHGVTSEFKEVKTWNPDFAGVISVWQDPEDGKTYVVNGHHRRELAGRLGVGDLPVRFIQAGSAKEARAIGALINIAEGRGTAIDAAKFMRDMGVGPDELDRRGVSMRGKVAADAVTLSKLSDRQFGRLAAGLLDEGKALAVAKHLASHDLQDQLFGMLAKREDEGKDLPMRVVEEMAREMASTPAVKSTQGGLFGDIESEESLFVPKNELKAHVRSELSKEVNDYLVLASKRRAEKTAGAGNTLNTEKNREIAQQAEHAKNLYDQLVNSKGPIADALNEMAGEYHAAKTKGEKNAVKERTLATVRDAIVAELDRPTVDLGGTGPGDRGGEEAPGAVEPARAAEVSDDAGRGPAGADGLTTGRHGPDAALARFDNRTSLPASGGLFGGEDLRARAGFAALPDGAKVVITDGQHRGKQASIVRDGDRIVAQVEGVEGTTPVSPDSVEPVDSRLSWRTEEGAAAVGKAQGGLFGGGTGTLATGQGEQAKAASAVLGELNAMAREGKDTGTIRGVRVDRIGVGRYRVHVGGKTFEGDQRQAADWIGAAAKDAPAAADAGGGAGGAGKEPWQVAPEEWDSMLSPAARSAFGSKDGNSWQHRNFVFDAIANGKPVPPEVEARYPGIRQEVEANERRIVDMEKRSATQKAAQEASAAERKAAAEKDERDQIAAVAAEQERKRQEYRSKLHTRKLSDLIAASGYKSNRGGVHDLIREDHRTAIESALASGKGVPPEVLADYPDLAAKYAPATTTSGTPAAPAASTPTPLTGHKAIDNAIASATTPAGRVQAIYDAAKDFADLQVSGIDKAAVETATRTLDAAMRGMSDEEIHAAAKAIGLPKAPSAAKARQAIRDQLSGRVGSNLRVAASGKMADGKSVEQIRQQIRDEARARVEGAAGGASATTTAANATQQSRSNPLDKRSIGSDTTSSGTSAGAAGATTGGSAMRKLSDITKEFRSLQRTANTAAVPAEHRAEAKAKIMAMRDEIASAMVPLSSPKAAEQRQQFIGTVLIRIEDAEAEAVQAEARGQHDSRFRTLAGDHRKRAENLRKGLDAAAAVTDAQWWEAHRPEDAESNALALAGSGSFSRRAPRRDAQ